MGKRTLTISSSLFVDLFGAGKHDAWEMTSDWLPDDTEIINGMVGIPRASNGGDITLLLQSKEWPEIPHGDPIPPINPTMKRLYLL